MSNDWLPDSGEQTKPTRGPLYFLIGSAMLLFLVMLVIVYQQMISSGRDVGADITPSAPASSQPAQAETEEPSPAEPSATPTPTPTPVRPAPEGAIEAAAFTTPAENIHCRINSDNAECSIYTYDYPSPGACEGITATYVVGAEGEVDADCRHFVQTRDVLDYGTAVANNGFACTLEQNGVTCWSVMSGHGFELKRAADRIF